MACTCDIFVFKSERWVIGFVCDLEVTFRLRIQKLKEIVDVDARQQLLFSSLMNPGGLYVPICSALTSRRIVHMWLFYEEVRGWYRKLSVSPR